MLFRKLITNILTMTGHPHFLHICVQISHCPLGQGGLPLSQPQMASLLALISRPGIISLPIYSSACFVSCIVPSIFLPLGIPSSLTYSCIYFFLLSGSLGTLWVFSKYLCNKSKLGLQLPLLIQLIKQELLSNVDTLGTVWLSKVLRYAEHGRG